MIKFKVTITTLKEAVRVQDTIEHWGGEMPASWPQQWHGERFFTLDKDAAEWTVRHFRDSGLKVEVVV